MPRSIFCWGCSEVTGEERIEAARRLRASIEFAAGKLSDAEALAHLCLFPVWREGAAYEIGGRVAFAGRLYRCAAAHTAGAENDPQAPDAPWLALGP